MIYTETLQNAVKQEISKRSLPDDFMQTVERWYLPVAEQIRHLKIKNGKPLLVSFNGAQGSGKSTITAFLRLILTHQFQLYTVEMSIDDFYLTHQRRQQLAAEIHPLLETRGVPGTHDIRLAVETLDCLLQCSADTPCAIPQFDKAIDDRKADSKWPIISRPVEVILFEGWCNHAPLQSASQLEKPVNELERLEDPDAIWRTYANHQLQEYHQQLFSRADLLIHLNVPSFEKVYEWRGLQEKKLAKQTIENNDAVMNKQQLKRFIEHYERITRRCLETLPELADIVLTLNDQHAIASIQVNTTDSANV